LISLATFDVRLFSLEKFVWWEPATPASFYFDLSWRRRASSTGLFVVELAAAVFGLFGLLIDGIVTVGVCNWLLKPAA
jgi:hypothetical protein